MTKKEFVLTEEQEKAIRKGIKILYPQFKENHDPCPEIDDALLDVEYEKELNMFFNSLVLYNTCLYGKKNKKKIKEKLTKVFCDEANKYFRVGELAPVE